MEAERWIVDLIRNYRIEGAKIDSKLGQVIVNDSWRTLFKISSSIYFCDVGFTGHLIWWNCLKVVMGAKTISIHEQVMENTKRLTFRSQQMALQLEKLKLDKKA